MAAEWHYTKEGQKCGPVSAAELKALAQAGKLTPTDMVWKAGMAEWKVASGVKGLFQTVTPVSSPPLPAPAAISPKLEGAPEPPSIAEAASPESGESPDSLSFTDKVKSRLDRTIGPAGANKLAGATSLFKKHRLWIGVGTGVAACIILILFLLPTGTLPGGKKGYTQAILDLDANQQKEFGIKLPKDAKALFAPGSGEDFIQSVTLINGEAQGWDVRDKKDLKLHYGDLGDFYVWWTDPKLISRKLWNAVYGQTESVTTKKEGIGYNRDTMVDVDYWTISCKDGALTARGVCTDKMLRQSNPGAKDKVIVQYVHFSTAYPQITPKRGESVKHISFRYK